MMKSRAGRKKVVLELGGNAACVIDDLGVGLNTIVDRLMLGGFSYRCVEWANSEALVIRRD